VQNHARGLVAATVFFKTTVVDCSFYFTLCKTTVVGCSPPIISGKYYLRIIPNGCKGSAFFCILQKNEELKIKNVGMLKRVIVEALKCFLGVLKM